MKTTTIFLSMSFIVLLIISAFQFSDNSEFLKRLKEKLGQFNAVYPQEKIYLQFDKPFYKPGEDIWFNAFVVDSDDHRPGSISEVMYVELIDAKGNISSKLELVIEDGTLHGDFSLSPTAPGGIYKVKAYTAWMKNYGEAAVFEKELQVQNIITPRLLLKLDFQKEAYGPSDKVSAKFTVRNLKNEKVENASVSYSIILQGKEILKSTLNSDKEGIANIIFNLPADLQSTDGLLRVLVSSQGTEESVMRSIPIVLDKLALEFFPEGGYSVENVSSKIAFKATNEYGKGADVTGDIIDQDNKVVTSFESFHMGMGAFNFKPAAGMKYYARIDKPAGNSQLIPLPEPLTNGYVLNLKERKGSTLEWTVFSPAKGTAYLVGQSHGNIYSSEAIKLRAGVNKVTTRTDDFPMGIGVFTLFDGEGKEQCERLVFLNQKKDLNIELSTDKEQYLPGEETVVSVVTTDEQGKPVPAKLSLSVVDDQLISLADDRQDNILSHMFLSSEVKGEIQEPSFYFDHEEPKAEEALDFLLMTQGWRRFSWEEVKNGSRPIVYAPEKVRDLSGKVVDSDGKGIATEITYLEMGNKKRIKTITTTDQGQFIFKNIDPTVPIIFLAKKSARVILQEEKSFKISFNDEDGTVMVSSETADLSVMGSFPEEETDVIEVNSGLDIIMDSDVSQLNEVVIVGYGAESKHNITASVQSVEREELQNNAMMSVESMLQGRVAGVIVQQQYNAPGISPNIMIRGSSSLGNGRNEPLFVIDGYPIGTSLNQNFSSGSMIGPEDITSIEVIASPEATALFGSSASNGAILITTRSRIGYRYSNYGTRQKKAKYSYLSVQPRKFSATREFYVPPPSEDKSESREDFRSTIHWEHTVITDEKGEAKVSFYNNDAVSAFRISAEGFSGSGLIGRKEEVYFTLLPYSLDTKIPEYIGFEDTLRLPVHVKNETSKAAEGKISLELPHELSVAENTVQNVTIPPLSSGTYWFTISTSSVEGDFPLSLKLNIGSHEDIVNHTIKVQPVGFPVRVAFSAREMDKTVGFTINEAEKGTIKAEVTAYPDVLSDLFSGAESILREPHGCFEQVSSSTFPNILALQFLQRSGLVRPEIESRALDYIENGYKKLKAYEIKGGGFEWFGNPPAHEGLTAYGLIQFYEMKKVYSKVDDKIVERTKSWLLSRRDGSGGFKQNKGKYGFSAASKDVNDAFILFSLSETGSKDILPEYQKALGEVSESRDMYRMALVANAAYNLNKDNDYNELIEHFRKTVRSVGFEQFKMDHSLVRSYGRSLGIETVALWAVALMRSPDKEVGLINDCIQYLISRRSGGYFGSTMGTTLALKALTEYAQLIRSTREDGEIQVLVDQKIADQFSYGKQTRGTLTLDGFSEYLRNDKRQHLRILYNNTSEPLPYSVNITWRTKTPPSSEECKLKLKTSLSEKSVRVNESVRFQIEMINKSSEGLPMSLAVVGIPAGLSLQSWQLKELQDKQVFDFYEIIDGKLVLYYREMAPGSTNIVNLDLKAEVAGTYTGAAGSAYLYYTDEYKDWTQGNTITIFQ